MSGTGRPTSKDASADRLAPVAAPATTSQTRRMRLASFNALHGLRPGDDAADPSRWPDVVAALDADVLALQEVDRAQPRSGGIDMTAVAADALGATDARFVPTLLGRPGRWRDARDPGADGPAHGIALLSRHPVTEWRTVALPQRAGRTWVRSAGRLLPVRTATVRATPSWPSSTHPSAQ